MKRRVLGPRPGGSILRNRAMTEGLMRIQVNGKQRTLSPGQTLSDLLRQIEVEPERVVVERNREIVVRDQFATTALEEGDTLEILHFVGGG